MADHREVDNQFCQMLCDRLVDLIAETLPEFQRLVNAGLVSVCYSDLLASAIASVAKASEEKVPLFRPALLKAMREISPGGARGPGVQ